MKKKSENTTISINRKEFLEVLLSASRCLEKRNNVIPILRSFKLSCAPGSLTVTATDLDQSVCIELPAICGSETDEADVETCVDGKSLSSIVAQLQDEQLDLEIDEKFLTIKRDAGDIKLRVDLAEKYPDVPFNDDYKLSFEDADFFEMCRSVLLGTSEDRAMHNHARNLAELSVERNLIEGKFRCIATDLHRLAIMNGLCATDIKEPFKIQIPITAIKTLLTAKNTKGVVQVAEDDHHLFVACGAKKKFTFRKMTTTFPDITKYLETCQFDHVISVNAEQMRNSVELVGQLIDPISQRINFALNGDLILSAQSSELGEIKDSLKVEIDFEPFDTGFNIQYILPVIREMSGEINLCFAKDVHQQKDSEGKVTLERIYYPMRMEYFRNNVTSMFDVQSLQG